MGMGYMIPVILAEALALKALAVVALCLVLYLYWTGLREKRAVRRHRAWQAMKRREYDERLAQERNQPPSPR